MAEKPTYEELEQRIKVLEKEALDHIRSEEALKESEDKYRLLTENSSDVIWTITLDGKFTFVSPAVLALSGFTPEELYNIPLEDKVTPESYNMLVDRISRELELPPDERSPSATIEVQQYTKDGSVVDVEVSANWILNDQGDPIGIQGATRNITARKRIEEALRKSEERHRDLYDNAPDMFASVNLKTTAILNCNKTLCNELGYAKEEMIGRSIFDIYTPESAKYSKENVLPAFVKYGTVKEGELQMQRKDGSIIDVSLNISAVRDEKGNIIQSRSIWRDITKQKKLEAQLQQAYKMEAIGTLTGGVAHDFNNILGIILGNTELALDDVPEWNPAHFCLEDIKTAGLRAAGIVKQLLSFSRKAGHEMKPIGIITVIKDALKFLRSTIPTIIEIRKNIPAADETILADPVQINQIMMNLCINASQEMEETGGILEINVEKVTLDEEAADSYPDFAKGNYLKLTVSDTGPGIYSEIINRIFDPSFTTREAGKGSGMGLSVVHGIVKNHNGAITVDSESGKGTTFTILFPMVTEKPEIETETTDKLPHGNERILFLDDEKFIVDITGRILERLGYQVETKMNPLEALELFQSKPDQFDLVITDMTMPQMTGVKLSKKLMEIRSDIPVIICTGHSSLIDEKKAKEMGIAAYVMKPIAMKNIAETIRMVLDNPESSD